VDVRTTDRPRLTLEEMERRRTNGRLRVGADTMIRKLAERVDALGPAQWDALAELLARRP
jgi:hypothetical protein